MSGILLNGDPRLSLADRFLDWKTYWLWRLDRRFSPWFGNMVLSVKNERDRRIFRYMLRHRKQDKFITFD